LGWIPEQRNPGGAKLCDLFANVRDFDRYVWRSGTLLAEMAPDWAPRLTPMLEKLERGIAQGHESEFDTIVIASFAPERLDAKHAFEGRDRLVNILHRDSDVI